MRLGIGSHTFPWAVGVPGYPPSTPMSASELLRRAVDLEVRVVQLADNLPLQGSDLDPLAAQARAAGLELELGTSGVNLQHLRGCLAQAERLGARLLRVVPDTETSHPSPQDLADALLTALPDFTRAGVTLAVENHDRFPAAILAAIMVRLNCAHAGICLDTANSLGCGEDLRTVVRELGPWVVNLHVKDFHVRRLPHQKGFVVEGAPAGQGQLELPWLLEELGRLRRDPNVIVELWPPMETDLELTIAQEAAWAEESVRYLRQFIPD